MQDVSSSNPSKHRRTTSWSAMWRRVFEAWKEGGDAVGTGEYLMSWLGKRRRKSSNKKHGNQGIDQCEELGSRGFERESYTLPEVETVCSAQLSKDGGLDISFSFQRGKQDKKQKSTVKSHPVHFPVPVSHQLSVDLENISSQINQPFQCDSPTPSPSLPHSPHPLPLEDPRASGPFAGASSVSLFTSRAELRRIPALNVVLMVVGTRGDVQPFVAFGNKLKECGHRVRLASHAVYREFVMTAGLEFYPLGGDPKVLIEYVVRNRGMIPGSMKDIKENRKQLKEIVFSTYDACTKPDPVGGFGGPFKADIIVANPPSYGHIHCAEKLGIPLHMMFTMPWTPTSYFPNPMARIGRTNIADQLNRLTKHLFHPLGTPKDTHKLIHSNGRWANYLSYLVVDECIWIGIRDIINDFRKSLQLNPIRSGNQLAKQMASLPWTYCWSQALVPKPQDWLNNIDVVGFFFLNMSELSKYQPPADLAKFLRSGPAPIYIGFGSLIVNNPKKLTKTIFDAVKQAGVRAIVSKGWAGLGEGVDVPANVLVVGNCPHDWLFPQCVGVIHHGGAGTTAAGLLAGCPTMVIPFFGDQPFWGRACYKAGLGPKPVLIDKLTTKKLVDAIHVLMKPQVRQAAYEISKRMRQEDGVSSAVDSFHRHLPIECIIKKDREGQLTWSTYITPRNSTERKQSTRQGDDELVEYQVQKHVNQHQRGTMNAMRNGFLKGFRELRRLLRKFQPNYSNWFGTQKNDQIVQIIDPRRREENEKSVALIEE